MTTVSRTLLDLAAVLDPDGLGRAWDEADRLGLLRLAELRAACDGASGRRGAGLVRGLVSRAAEPLYTRSALEDAFGAFCARSGLPTPVFNATVHGLEVDAYWPAARLAVELDGFAFHGHRTAFERDRERDAVLQASGIRIVRLTHRRLANSADEVAAQIRLLLGTG